MGPWKEGALRMRRASTRLVTALGRRLTPTLAACALLAVPFAISALTASPPGAASGDPVIAAAGDIACDPTNANFNGGAGTAENCRQRYTSDLLVGGGLAAVLPLGDNQYFCGGYQAFLQSYDQSWGRVNPVARPVVGNHEYLTDGSTGCDPGNTGAAGYFSYFGGAAGNAGEGYYSYDIGAWHLIALNSNCDDAGGCDPSSPQGRWLATDLAAHANTCTLAYWHIPLFSSGGRAEQNSASFWKTLYAAGVDVVLNGHDHIYERFAPQNPSGERDDARGIREFVVGTGGANHTGLATVAANSQIRNTSTYGVLKLTLHPGSYDWQFVPEAGATFTDSGTAGCSGSSQPAPPLFGDDFESGDLSRWTTVAGLRVDQAQVHAGAWAARASSGTSGAAAYANKQLSTTQTALSTKLSFKLVAQGNNVVDLFKLRTATGTALLTLFASPTGVLGYQNNVTTLSTYSRTTISPNAWHTLEVRVTINDANSQTQTWLDGQPVADLTKTEALGTTPIGRLQLGENITGRSYDLALDDLTLAPVDATAPSTPSAFTATPTDNSVALSWSPSTDDVGVAGYNVYQGSTRIASSAQPGYTVTGLQCATGYDFAVEAFDVAGNTSPRATVRATTMACPPPPLFGDDFESGDLSRWTTVAGLRVDQAQVHAGAWAARASSGTSGAAAYANKQLSTTQTALSTKLSFKLVAQGNNVVDLFKLRTATGTALLTLFASPTGVLGYQNNVTTLSTYSRTTISPNAWHTLEVRVTINDANSQTQTWLDGQPVADLTKTEALGTTPIGRLQLGENITGRSYDLALDDLTLAPVDATAPSTPSAFTATPTDNSVALSWSPSTDDVGVAGYNVYQGSTRIASSAQPGYTVTGLQCATGYDFAVEAFDVAGNTSPRATVRATTMACPPPPLFGDDFESGICRAGRPWRGCAS